MTAATDYRTHWLIRGERYTDIAEVEQLIERGAAAIEVTAEEQLAEAGRKGEQETKAERERLEAEFEAVARAYERSPEGRRESALREAAANPGGRVTIAGDTNGFDELQSWSKDADPLVGKWD